MYLLQNILEVLFKDVIFYKLVTNRLFYKVKDPEGDSNDQPTSEEECAKSIQKVKNVNRQQDT
jgi:hypothetical protein